MLYPFRCKPIYKEKVWGGRWLEYGLRRELPEDMLIGESWELSCRQDAVSEVLDGELAGQSLTEILHLQSEGHLGERICRQGIDIFPLLIKFLDASQRLSVQVHPDNEYMILKQLEESGKTEMWYVLDTEPDARLIIGIKPGVTPETFRQGIEEGRLDEYLTEVPVKPGDAFYIPAGTVHSILEGVRVAEIQQNSDTTYRIYDWNRLGLDGQPRALHIEEALEVINFDQKASGLQEGLSIKGEGWLRRLLTATEYFAVEELLVESLTGEINPQRFEVWMVIEGSGELKVQDHSYQLSIGETWFIPASLGRYNLHGNLKILRSYIPDLENEIVRPLRQMGYTTDDLRKIGGLDIDAKED